MTTELFTSGEVIIVKESKRRGGRTLWRGVVTALAVTTLIGGSAGVAIAAPGDTSSDTTVLNVGVTGAITLSDLTPTLTINGPPGTTVTADDAVAFTVTTNNIGGYSVTVVSDAPALVAATPGNADTIPVSAVGVKDAGAATYVPLSDTTPVVVHTQSGRSAEGGDDFTNDFTIDIPFVASDTYSTTLTYVATAL